MPTILGLTHPQFHSTCRVKSNTLITVQYYTPVYLIRESKIIAHELKLLIRALSFCVKQSAAATNYVHFDKIDPHSLIEGSILIFLFHQSLNCYQHHRTGRRSTSRHIARSRSTLPLYVIDPKVFHKMLKRLVCTAAYN